MDKNSLLQKLTEIIYTNTVLDDQEVSNLAKIIADELGFYIIDASECVDHDDFVDHLINGGYFDDGE
jgi:hypothetical protein